MNPLVNQLPTPLARSLQAFELETQPFRQLHRMLDLMEATIKAHTAVVVSDLFSWNEVDEKVRKLLAEGLGRPSLGTWWQFARECSRTVSEKSQSGSHQFPDWAHGTLNSLMDVTERGKSFGQRLPKGWIALRNSYAHGATPEDERCREDVEQFLPSVLRTLEQDYILNSEWVWVHPEGCAYRMRGTELQLLPESPKELESGQVYLMGSSEPISLHPLIARKTEDRSPEVPSFFFYNDLRKKEANYLNYEVAEFWRDCALLEVICHRFIPPVTVRANPFDAGLQTRLANLTEFFTGRNEDIDFLRKFVRNERRGTLMVWGAPGIGKSALLAQFTHELSAHGPGKSKDEMPGQTGAPGSHLKFHVCPWFIRSSEVRTQSPVVFFEMLLEWLTLRFSGQTETHKYIGQLDSLRDACLISLKNISSLLPSDERVVLVVDGLDEVEASNLRSMLESLPTEAPERFLFIYASRPEHVIHEEFFEKRIRSEERMSRTLGGLDDMEALEILASEVSKYELSRDYVEVVADRSQGNPLYLTLLAQSLRRGTIQIGDAASVPADFKNLYSEILKSIQRNKNFEAMQYLFLLALSREAVPAEMANAIICPDDLWGNPAVLEWIPLTRELLSPRMIGPDPEDAYGLFHESLSSFLTGAEASTVYLKMARDMGIRLADWALTWRDLEGASRRYAVRHLAYHLHWIARESSGFKDPDRIAYAQKLRVLAEDEEFITEVFDEYSEPGIHREACALAMEHVLILDPPWKEEMFRLAKLLHQTPIDRFEMIYQRLDSGEFGMEGIAHLAESGRDLQEKILLCLRGLLIFPDDAERPAELKSKVQGWLDRLGDPVIEKLCELNGLKAEKNQPGTHRAEQTPHSD